MATIMKKPVVKKPSAGAGKTIVKKPSTKAKVPATVEEDEAPAKKVVKKPAGVAKKPVAKAPAKKTASAPTKAPVKKPTTKSAPVSKAPAKKTASAPAKTTNKKVTAKATSTTKKATSTKAVTKKKSAGIPQEVEIKRAQATTRDEVKALIKERLLARGFEEVNTLKAAETVLRTVEEVVLGCVANGSRIMFAKKNINAKKVGARVYTPPMGTSFLVMPHYLMEWKCRTADETISGMLDDEGNFTAEDGTVYTPEDLGNLSTEYFDNFGEEPSMTIEEALKLYDVKSVEETDEATKNTKASAPAKTTKKKKVVEEEVEEDDEEEEEVPVKKTVKKKAVKKAPIVEEEDEEDEDYEEEEEIEEDEVEDEEEEEDDEDEDDEDEEYEEEDDEEE